MENQEIQLSLQQRKRKKFIHFVVKKSLNEPFPSEFGGRSKWDPDRLKPWKDLKGHGSLDMHMEAQFGDCFSFNMEKILLIVSPEKSTLDHVREIVRTIFHNFYYNSIYLFVVHTFCQQHQVYEPVFHLRLHQPVRVSPQGTPFLLASVIDTKLAQEFERKGKYDSATHQSDYYRIFTQGVEFRFIFTSSDEENNLFRYYLRANSTKMRRTAWQSKNLPRGEWSPWMSTFLSSLYSENIQHKCNEAREDIAARNEAVCREKNCDCHRHLCAACACKKIKMMPCDHCNAIYYCSSRCKQSHWPIHQLSCK